MMRFLSMGVAVLLLAGESAFAQEEVTNPLYPLKVGSKWTYKVPGGQVEVICTKKEKICDMETYRLETQSQGKVSASENVFVTDKGVFRAAVNGLKPESPIMFLNNPATKGSNWPVKTKVQGQDVEGTFTVKEEDVTVPKGKFTGATLIDGSSFKIASLDTSVKAWFVKDIGIVKLEFKLGGQDAVYELENYEPGK